MPGRARGLRSWSRRQSTRRSWTRLTLSRPAGCWWKVEVDSNGVLNLDDLASKLDDSVVLVSVMLANNETGVIAPLKEVTELARGVGALVHTDATQAVGKIPVDVHELGVDLASTSAHKFYGPKGIGALFVRRGVALAPLVHGGGHEQGMRSGTTNVPGAIGMGAAAQLAGESPGDQKPIREKQLVERLVAGLAQEGVRHGDCGQDVQRLPNTVNVRFRAPTQRP